MKNKIILLICFILTLFFFTACGNNKGTNNSENIDLDLSKASSTIVYSEIYNMTSSPNDYVDKIIKVHGTFTVNEDSATGKRYYSCVVNDATACCSQGIEFELAGKHKYPNDYPKIGDEIVVAGRFEVYNEDGTLYCRLSEASID